MAKYLDTSWFDLKNYEALKTLSIKGWQRLLEERSEFHDYVDDCNNEIYEKYNLPRYYQPCKFLNTKIPPTELLPQMVSLLKQGVTAHFEHSTLPSWQSSNDPVPLKSSINSLTVSDVWKISKGFEYFYRDQHNININDLTAEQQVNQKIHDLQCKIEIKHFLETSLKPFDSSDPNGIAIIKIDLYATDKQIKNDFSRWLKLYRQSIDIQPPKNEITQADFDNWIEFSVIPYLDLMLICKIEGKTIKQNTMANLFFPNATTFIPIERLRDTTKPKAERLINNQIHLTLGAQLNPLERKK